MPIVAADGVAPTIRLPAAAVTTDNVMAGCRPVRSASHPKSRPPKGRATNPTAKTASVLSSALLASPPVKNCVAKNAESVA